jgi:hypothetical protein
MLLMGRREKMRKIFKLLSLLLVVVVVGKGA